MFKRLDSMKITIVGTGYVGLVTGACFAEIGTEVCCVDIDAAKIERLQRGESPIYEPGLDKMLLHNIEEDRLHFTTSLSEGIKGAEAVFIAVGTPPDEDGSADLQYVLNVASEIGRCMDAYLLVVTKSTVPVGTSARIQATIAAELEKRKVEIPFEVASNPEFLKEGSGIDDFRKPDRIVVGVSGERGRSVMERLYQPFMDKDVPVLFMDIASAEMTKYAANSMLATRISFMNDIANLCQLIGADVNKVRAGIGSDSRIGKKFLYPGIGYGGSCFPKDVKALIKTAQKNGYPMRVLQAVEDVNENQKYLMFRKMQEHFDNRLAGKTVALWGLSFKPETDDMREAPSLVMIDRLVAAGCTVRVYDPVAMKECRRRVGDKVVYCKDMYEAVRGADALFLITEWAQFTRPDWNKVKEALSCAVIFDGRNLYDREALRKAGFVYYGVGLR